MAEPRDDWGRPYWPPTTGNSGRGMGNYAGGWAVDGRGHSHRGGRGGGGKRSKNRKKVCTRCGRFISADECTYCPPPQESKFFRKDVVTFRPCTSRLCRQLNYFRNQQCYNCGAFLPTEDGDEQHPVENSRAAAAMNPVIEREDAAKVLQRWVRGIRQVRRDQRFLTLIVATQAVWRGAAARRHLAKSRTAAVRLQALARRVAARAQWLRVRRAAVRIQARVRMGAAATMFCRKRTAAVTVQAVFRGAMARRHAARSRAARSRAAATRIQSLARGATTRARQARRNRAAVRVQARVRGRAAAAMFNRERAAIVIVQAVVRGAMARRRAAATRIQSLARGAITRARQARMNRAAVRIQARVRGRAAAAKFNRERTAIVILQAVFRGAIARRRAAATRIQSLARGATTRARQARRNRAAIRIQTHARFKEAFVAFRRKRDAAISVQAVSRGMLARSRFPKLRKAARRRKTLNRIGALAALTMVAAIMVGFLFGWLDNALPCQRGGTLRPGDAPLAPGECIEGDSGFRLFGWIPGFPARPRLSVTRDGKMIAKKLDGAEVVLAGHIPADRRNRKLFCGAERIFDILAGNDEPEYGARNAHGRLVLGQEYHCSVFRTPEPKDRRWRINKWRERGGHVGFSPDGDLEVVSSDGTVWWSLAAELAEDDDKKKIAGSAKSSRGAKKKKIKNKKKPKGKTDGDQRKKDKRKASPEPDRPEPEGGGGNFFWNR